MAWTPEARMTRAIANLISSGRIDRVDVYKRAKFFGQHAYRVNLGINLTEWVNFDELMREYHRVFDPMGAHLVGVKSTFDIYVYGSTPDVLVWLHKHKKVHINSFVQTDPAFWHKKLPPSRANTGKFFGEYRYRLRMRDHLWGTKPDNVNQLDQLEMDHKMVLKKWHHSMSTPGTNVEQQVRDTFVYVDKLSEVLVLKLMFGDQVAEVEDRG